MIHPTADVQTEKIGKETRIWQYCVVLPEARIGEGCNINAHCFVENDVVVGNNVTVKSGVQLWDGIVIDDNVFVGPNVTFANDRFPRSKQYPDSFLRTTICAGASIGANSTLVGGITIGKYSMIGAGSVVTKDVLPFSLVYGNPAKFRGWVCRCGNRLDDKLHCRACGSQYELENTVLSRKEEE